MCRWATLFWFYPPIDPRRSKSTPTGMRAAWKPTFASLSSSRLLSSTQLLDPPGGPSILASVVEWTSLLPIFFLLLMFLSSENAGFHYLVKISPEKQLWPGGVPPLKGGRLMEPCWAPRWATLFYLLAQVSSLFFIGRSNSPWKVHICTSIWSLKVPLVDHEECQTIYGEALYQVKGKVAVPMCTGSIIIVTWVHNILNVCSHPLSMLDQIIQGVFFTGTPPKYKKDNLG